MQKLINTWNKHRALEVWRDHIRKWRLVKRVIKVKGRKERELAFKRWISFTLNSRHNALLQSIGME